MVWWGFALLKCLISCVMWPICWSCWYRSTINWPMCELLSTFHSALAITVMIAHMQITAEDIILIWWGHDTVWLHVLICWGISVHIYKGKTSFSWATSSTPPEPFNLLPLLSFLPPVLPSPSNPLLSVLVLQIHDSLPDLDSFLSSTLWCSFSLIFWNSKKKPLPILEESLAFPLLHRLAFISLVFWPSFTSSRS